MVIGSGPRWRRHAAHHSTLALVVLASLVAAACGAKSRGVSPHPTASSTPPAGATPSATGVPYTFPAQWQLAANAPPQIAALAFAPSAPQTGYACTNAQSAGGGNAPPGFYTTSDGGQTWRAAANTPFQPSPPAGCIMFVDQLDPADLFLEQFILVPNSEGLNTPIVWRSRDGGATWHQIATLKDSNGRQTPWTTIAVVGSRLVASMGTPDPNSLPPPNDLFASDDGGATWQQIGQSITAQQLDVGRLVALGTTLVVEAHPHCACYSSAVPAEPSRDGAASRTVPLIAPASSFQTNSHWLSTDDGKTWTKMNLPAGQVDELSFARAPGASAYYGVAAIRGLDPTNLALPSVLYSADSGNSWIVLPAFTGAGDGYPDPTTLGAMGSLAIAPNGTVLASAWHDPYESGDAGIFTLRPSDGAPSWRPLVWWRSLGPAQGWQIVPASAGARLWALVPTTTQGSSGLGYVDVP